LQGPCSPWTETRDDSNLRRRAILAAAPSFRNHKRVEFEIKLMIAEIIGVLERQDDILGVWSSFEHDLLLYIWVLSNTSGIKIKLPSTYMEAHASYSILQG
ncbi:hypothetical protein U9M48_015667, partial [Paspalum notatum var. saurae]